MKSNPMTALVVRQGESVPRVSSLTIAESFGRNHKYVLQKIKELVADLPSDFTEPNFRLSEYEDASGRKLPNYLLTRDAFSLLVMGFTGKEALAWKLRYIEAFNALERELLGRRLSAAPEGVRLIRQGLALARRLTPARRREIRAAERYQALGLTAPEIGRLLNCGEKKVRGLLREGQLIKGGA